MFATHDRPRILRIPPSLTPPEILEQRRVARRGSWRTLVTPLVLVGLAVLGPTVAATPVVWGLYEGVSSEYLWLLGIGAGLVSLVAGVVSLGFAETLRVSHHRRRAELIERIEPWSHGVREPRWGAALVLLEELRGDDLDGPQARTVYTLTVTLSRAFRDLDRVKHALEASEGLPGSRQIDLRELAQQHQAAIDHTLSTLPALCAQALRGTDDAISGAADLVRDLNRRFSAIGEVEDPLRVSPLSAERRLAVAHL